MSLPLELCENAVAHLTARHPLTTVIDEPLSSPMSPDPVGSLRVWRGAPGQPVAKVVYVGLVVPMIRLDSHMVFAFTAADSAIPHFTLDSVYGGDYYAYHLDLIPRAELSSHLPYMDAAYQPLTEVFTEASAMDGLSRADIGPRQYALMSPWMLVGRATEEAFRKIGAAVSAYVEHWSALVTDGLPADVVAGLADTDLAARDTAVRVNLFSPDVDPVWARVTQLIGEPATARIRAELIGNE